MNITLLKRVVIVGSLVLAFLLILPFISPKRAPDTGPQKLVEVNASYIRGYEKGHLLWDIAADYVWAGRNRSVYKAERIRNGRLFDWDGTATLENLEADSLMVNTQSKMVVAQNVSAELIQKPESYPSGSIFAAEKQIKKVKIKSGEFKYFSITKKTYLYNGVEIQQDDAKIWPTQGVLVDNQTNIAEIEGGFTMLKGPFLVSGNRMIIHIDDEYAELGGNIHAIRQPTIENNLADNREEDLKQKPTELFCDQMNYSSKGDNRTFFLKKNVQILQDDKTIWADNGQYSEETGEFVVQDNVRFKTENMRWLLGGKEQFSNSDMQNSIDKPIAGKCDKLIFHQDSKELTFIGNVVLNQDDKVIKANKVSFYDDTQTLELVGEVEVIFQGVDSIKTQKLVVDIKNESFFANQEVWTEFRVNPTK